MLIQNEMIGNGAEKYLHFALSEESDEHDEEEGGLQIDLDFHDDVSVTDNHEPLDLSMKSRCIPKTYESTVTETRLPKIEFTPTFNFSNFENNNEPRKPVPDFKGNSMSESELIKLLEPYLRKVHKKFICSVCDTKFASKEKAVAHIENKHVECLQYKCPLCRASKGTRLGYESHLRRGHGVRVPDYAPVIRCKGQFLVKSEAQSSNSESNVNQPYDLQFVTFLREILGGKEKDPFHISCVEWMDKDEAIFRIRNREEFARRWYSFKGADSEPWHRLYNSVIKEFISRSIFKPLSGDLIFQVFCIKQLLKN